MHEAAEDLILRAVAERMSAPEPIRYVLERVEEEVRKLYAHVPETIRLKETELTAEERRLANFLDFVGEGRGTRALAKALEETERKVESLRDELQGRQASRESVFQTPPVEWIEERVVGLKDVLERRTEQSALLLRMRTSEDAGHPFRAKVDSDFRGSWTAISGEGGH